MKIFLVISTGKLGDGLVRAPRVAAGHSVPLEEVRMALDGIRKPSVYEKISRRVPAPNRHS